MIHNMEGEMRFSNFEVALFDFLLIINALHHNDL
jgi:hypothetical protein